MAFGIYLESDFGYYDIWGLCFYFGIVIFEDDD
jgi:hypothetical protein